MATRGDMRALAILERDREGEFLWTWSYPTTSSDQQHVFQRKCSSQLKGGSEIVIPFIYSQFDKSWFYIYTDKSVEDSKMSNKVTHVSLVLVTSDFNPEKYEPVCRTLCHNYISTGTPTTILEHYLSLLTRGHCTGGVNGTVSITNFDPRQAYATGPLRDVISRFGIEVILIYTAILLKKRVALYHSDIEELLTFSRSLPSFVWHRQNWNIVFPLTSLGDYEKRDWATNSHYIAGFTDHAIETQRDLYDLFVNLSTNELRVAPHAKESLSLGKLHKDLAQCIVQCCEDETKSNQQIIKEIAVRTKDLIDNMNSLATNNLEGRLVVSLETLRQRKLAAVTENFLFNLAAAEGLV